MSSHHQRYGRYIPTVSLTKLVLRYIPTESETKLFSSIKITDVKCPSVIPLVFADFLVVTFIIIIIIIIIISTTTTTLFYSILNPEKIRILLNLAVFPTLSAPFWVAKNDI
jgi:hypothetical protein